MNIGHAKRICETGGKVCGWCDATEGSLADVNNTFRMLPGITPETYCKSFVDCPKWFRSST